MKIRCLCLWAVLLAAWAAPAAAPPPQKLLPKDTVMLVTIPDSAKGMNVLTNSTMARLWRDPALKAFKDKFTQKLTAAVVEPLEQQLGLHFADYQGLAQGQMTLAVIPVDRPDPPGEHYAAVFILDTGTHASQLATNLAALKKKWVEAGKTLKTDKIRETEFATFITSTAELSTRKLLPAFADTNAPDELLPKPAAQKVELTFGQSGSLLLVSQSSQILEKILARQAGGLLPALEEEPIFQADFAARLQGSPLFLWFNTRALIGQWTKQQNPPAPGSVLAGAIVADGALSTLGFTGLTSASVAYRDTPDGLNVQFFVGDPESGRRGLLKIFATEAKDSAPPPFVPADAVKFSRLRLDLPKSWKTLESTLNQLNPQYAQLLNYVLSLAGKDKDEKYDLRAELLDSLGDDIISYQRNPVHNTLGDLRQPPSLCLLGSPNPDKLAAAIKVALGVIAPAGSIKDREFLGRKIYSTTLPFSLQGGNHSYHFAAGAGYVAITGDVEMLEEFLRSGDGKTKGLADTPGLGDAAQQGGGMGAGIFAFSNDKENMRTLVETLRHESVALPDLLGLLGLQSTTPKISTVEDANRFKEWVDFSLLPPVDVLAKYFNYSVWVGGFTPDGFTINCFTPNPPPLK